MRTLQMQLTSKKSSLYNFFFGMMRRNRTNSTTHHKRDHIVVVCVYFFFFSFFSSFSSHMLFENAQHIFTCKLKLTTYCRSNCECIYSYHFYATFRIIILIVIFSGVFFGVRMSMSLMSLNSFSFY
jgi:ammonia channel protein AmtB